MADRIGLNFVKLLPKSLRILDMLSYNSNFQLYKLHNYTKDQFTVVPIIWVKGITHIMEKLGDSDKCSQVAY